MFENLLTYILFLKPFFFTYFQITSLIS
uniref:Uncharacterized protein n=1 Tax=Rhizophora mucronata TaxID=61149 RepID=A0A2P2PLQ1_RHIMU